MAEILFGFPDAGYKTTAGQLPNRAKVFPVFENMEEECAGNMRCMARVGIQRAMVTPGKIRERIGNETSLDLLGMSHANLLTNSKQHYIIIVLYKSQQEKLKPLASIWNYQIFWELLASRQDWMSQKMAEYGGVE